MARIVTALAVLPLIPWLFALAQESGPVDAEAVAPPAAAATTFGATVTKDPIAPDGTQIQVHLPNELHMKNVGGSDGAGLCVFTSLNHSAYWQNLEQLWRFQEWMRRRPGGGYPEKVDKTIAQFCQEQGAPKPKYIQVESADLEVLKVACKAGRMPGVTYGFSPSGRYGGAKISHMVSLVHADEKWFCILDNNFPQTYEWMTPQEFSRCYTSGGRTGWAVIFLNPGPPPSPSY